MKWVLIVIVGLAGLMGLMALIGVFVSRDHRATSTISLRQSPDSVWKVVRDLGGITAWFPAMQQSERLPDRDGHEVWHQKMSGFDVPIIVLESSPPRTLVTQIDPTAGGAFGGTWTYEGAPDSAGKRSSVTEGGWVNKTFFPVNSPLFFWLFTVPHKNL